MSQPQPAGTDQSQYVQPHKAADITYLCAGTNLPIPKIFQKPKAVLTFNRATTTRRYPASLDCGAENTIRVREPIRCRECGHRIMYKKRTKQSAYPPLILVVIHLTNTSALIFSGTIRGSVMHTVRIQSSLLNRSHIAPN